jgi:riboflavin kinase/FMN adenylyltransferase
VLAIGAFDGIHRGHRHVVDTARTLAERLNARVGVLRFHPHPARVLRPDAAPPLLCTEQQIHDLLAVDLQLRLPFTPELAAQEPRDFLDMLAAHLPGLRGVVTGPNWHFGRAGRGDVALLRQVAAQKGWHVETATDTLWDNERISSTRIRNALERGDLAAATAMLGRPYVLQGRVRDGKKFGRELGFPTANFLPLHELLPPPGVYAMRVTLGDSRWNAAGYLTASPALVEVHLLDFQGDLYGQDLEVALLDYRRPATPISDMGVLRARIAEDVRGIRAYFQELTP